MRKVRWRALAISCWSGPSSKPRRRNLRGLGAQRHIAIGRDLVGLGLLLLFDAASVNVLKGQDEGAQIRLVDQFGGLIRREPVGGAFFLLRPMGELLGHLQREDL